MIRWSVDVGRCLLLVDMDIWYRCYVFLWELMKASKQRVRSKALDGKEKRQNLTVKNLRRQRFLPEALGCGNRVGEVLIEAHHDFRFLHVSAIPSFHEFRSPITNSLRIYWCALGFFILCFWCRKFWGFAANVVQHRKQGALADVKLHLTTSEKIHSKSSWGWNCLTQLTACFDIRGWLALGILQRSNFQAFFLFQTCKCTGVNWGFNEGRNLKQSQTCFFSEQTAWHDDSDRLFRLTSIFLTEAPSGDSSTGRSWSNSAWRQSDPLPLNLKLLDIFFPVFVS